MNRCQWCLGSELEMVYHDNEWGTYVGSDESFFEFLVLESFQAGLSWKTILFKRERMRALFYGFDRFQIAATTEETIAEWLMNPGIIRSVNKIRAMISNAALFSELVIQEGSFENYLKRFIPDLPVDHHYTHESDVPGYDEVSTALTIDLKKKGFKYVGPTIIYAFLQATGVYNDHVLSCFKRQ